MIKKIVLSSLLVIATANASKPILPNILNPDTTKKIIHSNFERTGPTIQIGILLDTSGSMNGLIDQAKDQLWKIVNEVAKANKNNKEVTIQVGLFEYGKSSIPSYEGYIQMLSPLTSDLDKVSQVLFDLKTDGGEEYAGKVILESVNRFAWSDNKDDLKILIIAGNESFAQGKVSYQYAIQKARQNNIIVNTIFCGSNSEGRNWFWSEGADLGNGKYFNIDHNDRRVYIQTPYDSQIIILGKKLNTTYIKYGAAPEREEMRKNVLKQDKNSKGLSKTSYIERNIMKSKSQFALADTDMVSSYIAEGSIDSIKKENMPTEFQNKDKEEITKIVKEKKEERESIQKEIRNLENKRDKFLKENDNSSNDLGSAIIKTIRVQAEKNGFKFSK